MSNASSKRTSNAIKLAPITLADVKGRRHGANALTIDRMGRLCLLTAVRSALAITDVNAFIYISVDPAAKTVGIVRQDVVNAIPDAKAMRVDQRGYVPGRVILDKLGLRKEDGPYRFDFVGKIDSGGAHWHAFKLEE